MRSNKHKQTGPITVNGKQRSSLNARTHGLYTKTLLPNERPEDLKSLVASLQKDWPVTSTTGQLLIYHLATLMFRKSRLEAARSAMSSKALHDHGDRVSFCIKLGLDTCEAERIPEWFFEESTTTQERCALAGRIRQQATFLKDNYSTHLVEMAVTNLPDLWRDVMGTSAPNFNTSIVERMCQVHKCESNELAVNTHLQCVMDRFEFELMWTEKRERIKNIVECMRATKIIDAMSRGDLMKLESSLEGQTIDTIRQLMSLIDFQQYQTSAIEMGT